MIRWTHHIYTAIVCLIVCTLYYNYFINKAWVEVDLEVSQKTDFKVYWAEKGQPFSEKNMSVVIAQPGKSQYSFYLTDIENLVRLRIDTHKYVGEATLRRLTINQKGYAPIILSDSRGFSKLVPLAQIEDFRAEDDGLWLRSTGDDPNFELIITPDYQGIASGQILFQFAVIILFVIPVLLVLRSATWLAKDFLFVPVLLTGIWVVIITMAGISERNVHPDEYVHLSASSYYDDHWLPPLLEDESISHTYSVYGVSRLNNGEIYYLFCGKFHKLLENFKIPEYLSLRMFNVCLFGLILLFSLKNRYARMVAIPFLLSPQLWYVFSYCTSDAFALFISFLIGYELVNPGSLFNRLLKGSSQYLFPGLALGLLLGCLFLLKKNYYPFIVFFYICLGAQLLFETSPAQKRKVFLKRLITVTVVGLLFFGLRFGADYMVNGFDRNVRLAEIQEKMANTEYKASTELEKKQGALSRKARGTTLNEMVTLNRWFEKSFRSGFGVFGYFTISSPLTYFDLMRWTGLALLVFVFGSILFRGGLINTFLALSLFLLSGALIAVSFYHSWTVDFQAQGRYLFPIMPMLGILYAKTYRIIHRPIFITGVGAMYILGMYAFIFEALLKIPKVGFH